MRGTVEFALQADAGEQFSASVRASGLVNFRTSFGASMMFSPALMVGNRLNCSKHHSDFLPQLAHRAHVVVLRASGRRPIARLGGRFPSPLMQRRSVLLPEPLRPMMQTTSLRSTAQVDAFEHFVIAKRLCRFSDLHHDSGDDVRSALAWSVLSIQNFGSYVPAIDPTPNMESKW